MKNLGGILGVTQREMGDSLILSYYINCVVYLWCDNSAFFSMAEPASVYYCES